MKKILGVSRSHRFSPNSIDRDNAIFQAVAVGLRVLGYEVATMEEDKLTRENISEDTILIYSMARSEKALGVLAEAEQRGVFVVNSAKALLRGTREWLSETFGRNVLPVAPSQRIDVEELHSNYNFSGGQRYWLKRGDACAQSATDVCCVGSMEELQKAARNYSGRRIANVLLSPHIEGDLVKFYGVEATDFFHLYYPTREKSFSKFGLERFNGEAVGYSFSEEKLKDAADACARVSGFGVYGGDAVVKSDGSFLIIDFNDWPSFSRCCNEAAEAIVQHLLRKITDKN